jgi:broad specificity phosphatase PhoE
LVSSDEQKAWETLGGEVNRVVRDERFNEVHRVGEPWDSDVQQRRRSYVQGAAHSGWERQEDASARFDAGVVDLVRDSVGHSVVFATHGMVMTTWLVSRGAVPHAEAGAFWASLRFPDCIAVAPDRLSWRRYP